jgi:hypothetical protein
LRSSGTRPTPRRRGAEFPSLEKNAALLDGVESEQGRTQFAAARAHQSRDAQHFTLAQFEGNVLELAGGEMLDRERHGLGRRFRGTRGAVQVAAYHHAD